jgi:hypothetical protein
MPKRLKQKRSALIDDQRTSIDFHIYTNECTQVKQTIPTIEDVCSTVLSSLRCNSLSPLNVKVRSFTDTTEHGNGIDNPNENTADNYNMAVITPTLTLMMYNKDLKMNDQNEQLHGLWTNNKQLVHDARSSAWSSIILKPKL